MTRLAGKLHHWPTPYTPNHLLRLISELMVKTMVKSGVWTIPRLAVSTGGRDPSALLPAGPGAPQGPRDLLRLCQDW